MDGVRLHDELRQPFTLFVPLQTMDADMKLFRRPSRPDLRVKISDDDLVEGMIFLLELLQLHVECLDFFVIVVRCWCVDYEDRQRRH